MKNLLFILLFLLVSVNLNAQELIALNNYSEEVSYNSVQSESTTQEIGLKEDESKTEKISAVAKIKSELSKESGIADQKPWKIKNSDAPSITAIGGNMVKGLALCLGMIFIVLSILKRFKFAKTNIPKACKVLETLKLTDKSKLLLIEVEGKKIAISVGTERVSAIHEFRSQDSKLKIQNKTEDNIINEQGLELLCQ